MSGHRPWRELRDRLNITPERAAAARAALDEQQRRYDEEAHQALASVARVRGLHMQYRAGSDTTDYCAHCNSLSGQWVPWPCPTIQAVDGTPAG